MIVNRKRENSKISLVKKYTQTQKESVTTSQSQIKREKDLNWQWKCLNSNR